MEPRVFSGGTADPKGEHRILGLWVRPDAESPACSAYSKYIYINMPHV